MINLNLGEKTEKIGILEKIEFFFILNFYYISKNDKRFTVFLIRWLLLVLLRLL